MSLAQQASSLASPSPSPAAPLQIELRFRLNLPASDVFELMTTRLPEWFSAVHGVRWNHDKSTRGAGRLGACSERVCDFGGKTLVEQIVAFEPGRSYAYSADMVRSEMKMPLRDHLGTFEVVAGPNGTEVTWRQHFRALWFVPAFMLRWQMRDKLMRPAIDGLIAKHGGAWLGERVRGEPAA